MDNSLRVIKFKIDNYKGIVTASAVPDPNVVLVEGDNASGKTSMVDAIWSTIGGPEYGGESPVRNGAAEAQVSVNLGPITVQRVTTKDKTKLKIVDNKTGFEPGNPATVMKGFYSACGFDIEAFIRMEDKERYGLLLRLSGQAAAMELLDRQRKQAYDERTIANRQRDDAAAKAKGRGYNDAVVAGQKRQEKSMAEVLERLNNARAEDRERERFELYITEGKDAVEEGDTDIQRLESEIIELEKLIAGYKQNIREYKVEQKEIQAKIAENEQALQKHPPSRAASIEQELAEVETYNQQVREDNQVFDLLGEVAAHTTRSQALTADLTAIDESKRKLLAQSSLPIKDITQAEDRLLFAGKPFNDLSTTEQLIMSMEIGAALNPVVQDKPNLRIMRIQNGGEFTPGRLAIVREWAVKNNYQVWIELPVEKYSGKGIYIEDGEIKG